MRASTALFRRRLHHRHLLPAGVHRAHARGASTAASTRAPPRRSAPATGPACAAGPSSRPATRASTPCARLAHAAARLIEAGALNEAGWSARRAARRHRPPPAARVRVRVRRDAGRDRADAPPAAGEAAAHGYGAAGDRGRVRERLRERAALQRAVQARAIGCSPTRLRRKHVADRGAAGMPATSSWLPPAATTGPRCSRSSARAPSPAWSR